MGFGIGRFTVCLLPSTKSETLKMFSEVLMRTEKRGEMADIHISYAENAQIRLQLWRSIFSPLLFRFIQASVGMILSSVCNTSFLTRHI